MILFLVYSHFFSTLSGMENNSKNIVSNMKMLTLLPLFLVFITFISCKKESEEPTPTEEENYHLQAVGKSANDLLSSDAYSKLTIEVVYATGHKLADGTLTNAKTFLQERLNKPDGIEFTLKEITSPGLAPYSVDDLQKIERDHRSIFNEGDNLTAFLFVADGEYANNNNVLGVAYQNTSMALFHKKIDAVSGGLGQPSSELLETTVMHHELGHIMGLVNVGSDMQTDHQDSENGHHCDVDDCLMYWAVETGDFVSNLVGQSGPPSLDAQCIADLQANGGK